MPDVPIACTLTGPDIAQRSNILRVLLGQATSIDEITNGLRWRFAATGGLLTRLGAIVDAERECCRFLRFAIVAEPDASDVTLEVTGPEGTREFLQSWLETR